MSRRLRRVLLAAVALIVLVIGGGFAAFAIRGRDAPPPPQLSTGASPEPEAEPAEEGGEDGSGTWEVASGGSTFVGYRVRERFVTVGVVDAVGRTGGVTGTAEVAGERVVSADLEADMASLRSDEGRRDNALRTRGIETDRFPTARFELTEPFRISHRAVKARDRLTLHGRTQPITATVSGQRPGGGEAVELAGSAPIAFDRFAIEPPSVAGFVTVRDTGRLEFKLRLVPR